MAGKKFDIIVHHEEETCIIKSWDAHNSTFQDLKNEVTQVALSHIPHINESLVFIKYEAEVEGAIAKLSLWDDGDVAMMFAASKKEINLYVRLICGSKCGDASVGVCGYQNNESSNEKNSEGCGNDIGGNQNNDDSENDTMIGDASDDNLLGYEPDSSCDVDSLSFDDENDKIDEPATILPPPLKRLPGRPIKHRRRELGEAAKVIPSKRATKVKCGVCGRKGHNKRTCDDPTVESSTTRSRVANFCDDTPLATMRQGNKRRTTSTNTIISESQDRGETPQPSQDGV
ncbi:hypothetical protein Salat_0654100 [Sesamum alatum]|uniref:CCHC-type domain-containing protein n=1 Tax=Sesamum alatum TaxID=300844 RepID=A0AAE2CUE6_9LAMI|nr:hypothetical protein Salat_0654100 [Sesamum alatum]